MAGRFSDRRGVTKPRRRLQIESMDAELRNTLWNWLCWALARDSPTLNDYWWLAATRGMWDEFFHLPVDEIPTLPPRAVRDHVK